MRRRVNPTTEFDPALKILFIFLNVYEQKMFANIRFNKKCFPRKINLIFIQ